MEVLASVAELAEDTGWDGIFIWDELLPVFDHSSEVAARLGPSGVVADPMVALVAAAAARTRRLRFGALVSALPRLRPEAFALAIATDVQAAAFPAM